MLQPGDSGGDTQQRGNDSRGFPHNHAPTFPFQNSPRLFSASAIEMAQLFLNKDQALFLEKSKTPALNN
jgi:hypothetical protein